MMGMILFADRAKEASFLAAFLNADIVENLTLVLSSFTAGEIHQFTFHTIRIISFYVYKRSKINISLSIPFNPLIHMENDKSTLTSVKPFFVDRRYRPPIPSHSRFKSSPISPLKNYHPHKTFQSILHPILAQNQFEASKIRN